jgi:hypothetical protein
VPPAVADAVYASLAAAPFTSYVVLLDPERGRAEFPELFEDAYGTGAHIPRRAVPPPARGARRCRRDRRQLPLPR